MLGMDGGFEHELHEPFDEEFFTSMLLKIDLTKYPDSPLVRSLHKLFAPRDKVRALDYQLNGEEIGKHKPNHVDALRSRVLNFALLPEESTNSTKNYFSELMSFREPTLGFVDEYSEDDEYDELDDLEEDDE